MAKSKKKCRQREYSSSSSGSSSGEEEVVWNESKPKDESNEWFDLFEKNCSKNEKTKQNKRIEEKKEKQLNDQKIRQQRELNPFIRYDSEGNHIIDEPRQQNRSTGSQQTPRSRQLQQKSSSSSIKSLSERNAINAKLLKAEIMGNQSLIKELKEKLKQLETNESEGISNKDDDNEDNVDHYSAEKMANEESMSLKELYFMEKKSTAEDENRRFVATSSKTLRYPEEEYEESGKKHKKQRHNESKVRYVRQEDEDRNKCRQCFENIDKQLILSVAEKTIISLTPFEPFVSGMCFIISKNHSNVSTISSDEQCLEEINQRKHQISKFFAKQNKTVIFMETYYKKRLSNRHLVIECIPIKSKYETDSKIYFKKAIMECEGEWSMNKKVIEIKDKPITRLIPKGLSYFWVTIGPKNDGFGHVIEDEESFSPNFGKEIIGGILDIEPNKWNKPKHQNYDQQFERVVNLKNNWNKLFEQ